MSDGCICGRCCGENRTDPDCKVCNPRAIAPAVSAVVLDGLLDINNIGHGHVFLRADGNRMRCGGPGLCKHCKADQQRKDMMTGTVDKVAQESVDLLVKAAHQFRYYERNHRAKMTDPDMTRAKVLDTYDKAEANAAIAKEIEDYLNELKN